MRFLLLFSIALCLLHPSAHAQNMGSSPYSQLGTGDLVNPAFGPHQAMGSAGVAYGNGLFVNNLNPALWARNRNVVLELGVAGQYKRMSNGTASQRIIGGNLNYLALALPVARHWTTGLVLLPLSSVNYDINGKGAIGGRPNLANYRFVGRGGLSSVNWHNGVSLFKSRLFVGLQTAYIFGATTQEFISRVDSLPFSTAYQQRFNASGFSFKPGAAWRKAIRYNRRDSLKVMYLSLAGTYDFAAKVAETRDVVLENRGVDANGQGVLSDTVIRDQRGSLRLPTGFRLGFNLERPFHWAVSGDIYQHRWSEFRSFLGGDTLRNTLGFGLGGEWTPDINSVNSYLKRMTFRAGIHYSQMPLAHRGRQLTDRSVSFGVFLPITPQDRSGVSYLNTTFIFGRRGDEALLRENYFRIVFGFSINAFDWFRRYKID